MIPVGSREEGFRVARELMVRAGEDDGRTYVVVFRDASGRYWVDGPYLMPNGQNAPDAELLAPVIGRYPDGFVDTNETFVRTLDWRPPSPPVPTMDPGIRLPPPFR
jgi:hypothetical protein